MSKRERSKRKKAKRTRERSDLRKQLLSHSLAAGAALVGAQYASADIVYSGPQNITVNAGNPTVGIDFDGVGGAEFSINFQGFNTGWTNTTLVGGSYTTGGHSTWIPTYTYGPYGTPQPRPRLLHLGLRDTRSWSDRDERVAAVEQQAQRQSQCRRLRGGDHWVCLELSPKRAPRRDGLLVAWHRAARECVRFLVPQRLQLEYGMGAVRVRPVPGPEGLHRRAVRRRGRAQVRLDRVRGRARRLLGSDHRLGI